MRSFYERENLKKYGKLLVGLFLCGVGIVMVVNSNLGGAPWDVFHIGISKHLGIQYGKVSIIMGAVVVLLNIALGQVIGLGTLLNMCLIGTFTDLINNSGFIPSPTGTLPLQSFLLAGGILAFGYGTYLYMAQGKGAGPRDGLMQVLNRKTGISVAIVKNGIEVIVLLIGILLGGKAGIGTIVYALSIGFVIQFLFDRNKIDIKALTHAKLKEEILSLLPGGREKRL